MVDSADSVPPLRRLLCTSTSCVIADSLCLPCDLVKARLQLQNELLPASAPRVGAVETARRVVTAEGVGGLWAGLPAAAARQATYGGLSFFSYPFVRDALAGGEKANFAHQLVAGALSGARAAQDGGFLIAVATLRRRSSCCGDAAADGATTVVFAVPSCVATTARRRARLVRGILRAAHPRRRRGGKRRARLVGTSRLACRGGSSRG